MSEKLLKPAYQESINFDFIRTCGVFIVLATHLLAIHGSPVMYGVQLNSFGELAIIFFFVHSAWVLMMSMERQKDKFGDYRFLSYFYTRRLFRIFPVSIFTVGTIALFNLPMMSSQYPMQAAVLNTEELLANFLLIENFYKAPDILGPIWSLAVEFQAYILFPFAFLALRKTKSLYPLMFLWAMTCFTLVAFWPKVEKLNHLYLDYYQIPDIFEWIPCFLAGMIAYKIAEHSKKTWPFWTVPLFVLFALPVYALRLEIARGYFISIGVAILLTQAKEMKHPGLIWFSKLIARYSYTSYLFHYFSMWLAFQVLVDQPMIVQWVAFFGSLCGICYLGHHLIEKPGIQLGAKLSARMMKNAPKVQPVEPLKQAS